MFGKPTFATLAVAALLPVQVLAQDISGAATLGFGAGKVSNGGEKFTALSLDSQTRMNFANGLSLGAGLSLTRLDVDGLGSDPTLNAVNLDLRYGLANGVNFGAYVERAGLNEASFWDESTTSFGLLIGRSTDLVDFQFFVGATDITDASGLDWTDVGVSVSKPLGNAGVIGGHIVNSRVSIGADDMDMTSIGLGGAYNFGNGVMGFGGLTYATTDLDTDDITTVGLGLGYDLSGWLNLPVVASLELSRSRISEAGVGNVDMDTVRFGLTLPLGGSGVTAPLNSIAAAAMAPRRNAVTTMLLGAY